MIPCQCVRTRVCGCPPVPLGVRRAECLRDASRQSDCNSIAPRAAQTRSVGEAGVSPEQEQTWVSAPHLRPQGGPHRQLYQGQAGVPECIPTAFVQGLESLGHSGAQSGDTGRAAWPGLACPGLPSGTSPGSSWDRPAGCWGELRPHCLRDPREKPVWDRVFAVSGSVPHARLSPLGLVTAAGQRGHPRADGGSPQTVDSALFTIQGAPVSCPVMSPKGKGDGQVTRGVPGGTFFQCCFLANQSGCSGLCLECPQRVGGSSGYPHLWGVFGPLPSQPCPPTVPSSCTVPAMGVAVRRPDVRSVHLTVPATLPSGGNSGHSEAEREERSGGWAKDHGQRAQAGPQANTCTPRTSFLLGHPQVWSGPEPAGLGKLSRQPAQHAGKMPRVEGGDRELVPPPLGGGRALARPHHPWPMTQNIWGMCGLLSVWGWLARD